MILIIYAIIIILLILQLWLFLNLKEKNVKVRKANYESSNTAGEWENAFKDVLKFMNDKIGDWYV